MKSPFKNALVRIVLLHILFAGLWIHRSDWLPWSPPPGADAPAKE